MGPPAQRSAPAAPVSPIKTVEEAEMDINMEVFDGEFLDEGGDSFYDMEEISGVK
jgi:hypothetical protein